MSISSQFSIASLYDGGWRNSDLEELMTEYGFTQEEATAICEALTELEK